MVCALYHSETHLLIFFSGENDSGPIKKVERVPVRVSQPDNRGRVPNLDSARLSHSGSHVGDVVGKEDG